MYLLFSSSFIILNTNKGLKLKLSAQEGRFHQQTERMNRNLAHIRRGMLGQRQCPAAAAVGDDTGPDGNIVRLDNTAKLINHPKSLSILWREYMFGVGTNKPARDFTSQEKQKYKNDVYSPKAFLAASSRKNDKCWLERPRSL